MSSAKRQKGEWRRGRYHGEGLMFPLLFQVCLPHTFPESVELVCYGQPSDEKGSRHARKTCMRL